MHPVDWLILALPLLIALWLGWKTRRYVHGVADFMAGGRAAGRYLLTTAEMMAATGLISAVAAFESQFDAGFAYAGPWGILLTPIGLILTLTGYLVYRYRETRVLTMAQLFEIRYSKSFRIFAGVISAVAGILNFGIFPAVAGRFFVYFCGLPEHLHLFGYAVQTFALLMAVFLGLALLLVLQGGQFTILVIDSAEAVISYVLYIVVAVFLIWYFSMDQVKTVLNSQPPGHSFTNPWDISQLQDFNLWFWLIAAFGGFYGMMSWQGNQGFNAAAANPHEAKMGKILSTFRSGAAAVMFKMVVIAAMVFLMHPDFRAQADSARVELAGIANPAIRKQMTVPIAASQVLWVGVKGAFCAIMFFKMLAVDVSYLHSWGGIVIQDVVLPFRKRPFTPRQQLTLLRLAIVGVALYAFLFSLLFEQTTYILMFQAHTGAIYLSAAGACIVGALYWKKATAAGAWAAMTIGAGISLIGIVCEKYWGGIIYPWLSANAPDVLTGFQRAVEWLTAHIPHLNWRFSPQEFPINGQWFFAIAMFLSIASYITVSLLTCRRQYEMDKLLHRGKYGVDAEGRPMPKPPLPKRTWKSFIGIEPTMTPGDRRLTYLVFYYTNAWFLLSLIILIWNVVPAWRWSQQGWTNWFLIETLGIGLGMGLITTVWFSWGTIRDLRRLFKTLATYKRDVTDDGRVRQSGAPETATVALASVETVVPQPSAATKA